MGLLAVACCQQSLCALANPDVSGIVTMQGLCCAGLLQSADLTQRAEWET